MQITEQAQRLAEEYANKQMGIPDFNKELTNPQNQAIHESLEDGFIAGFSASRWIEVTPDSMPEVDDLGISKTLLCTDCSNINNPILTAFYSEDNNTWHIEETGGQFLVTHYQFIEPPKPSKK